MSRQPGAAGSLLPEARRLPPDQKERAGEAGIQARHRSLTLTYPYQGSGSAFISSGSRSSILG
jgi:hypothetical protein